jgi:hypothetical protein
MGFSLQSDEGAVTTRVRDRRVARRPDVPEAAVFAEVVLDVGGASARELGGDAGRKVRVHEAMLAGAL